MTAFFGVHLVLTVVSLTLGTVVGGLGVRALRASRRACSLPAVQDRELQFLR